METTNDIPVDGELFLDYGDYFDFGYFGCLCYFKGCKGLEGIGQRKGQELGRFVRDNRKEEKEKIKKKRSEGIAQRNIARGERREVEKAIWEMGEEKVEKNDFLGEKMCESGSSGGEESEMDEISGEIREGKDDFGESERKEEEVKESKKKGNFVMDVFGGHVPW